MSLADLNNGGGKPSGNPIVGLIAIILLVVILYYGGSLIWSLVSGLVHPSAGSNTPYQSSSTPTKIVEMIVIPDNKAADVWSAKSCQQICKESGYTEGKAENTRNMKNIYGAIFFYYDCRCTREVEVTQDSSNPQISYCGDGLCGSDETWQTCIDCHRPDDLGLINQSELEGTQDNISANNINTNDSGYMNTSEIVEAARNANCNYSWTFNVDGVPTYFNAEKNTVDSGELAWNACKGLITNSELETPIQVYMEEITADGRNSLSCAPGGGSYEMEVCRVFMEYHLYQSGWEYA